MKSSLTGIITFSELDWKNKHQLNFKRFEESIAIKLGRMFDSGSNNLVAFLFLIKFLLMKYQEEKNYFFEKEFIV